MFGVVVAAHGGLAPALLQAAEVIVGGIENTRAVALGASASPEALRESLTEAVQAVDQGDGVLVLCDMFGGTPANVCLASQLPARLEVVTGVNLPMLLRVATTRGEPLEEAARSLVECGQRHIANASALLREKRRAAERDADAGPR
jgi:PTS system mannose-specific IIA component